MHKNIPSFPKAFRSLMSKILLASIAAYGTAAQAVELPNAYLVYRVYLPTGSSSNVPLPSLTFSYSDGRPSKTITPCTGGLVSNVLTNIGGQLTSGKPACGWSVFVGGASGQNGLNIAYPDSIANYWATPFSVDSKMTITINGKYPDARYMSFNMYTANLNSLAGEGVVSGLADYKIQADEGYVNPWMQPASSGGKYTLRVMTNTVGQTNAMNMPPYMTPQTPGFQQPCQGSDCPPLNRFSLLPSGGLGPNVDNAYVVALTQPQIDEVLIVRGKKPTAPNMQYDTHPVAWPQAGSEVRYWSLCNGIYRIPMPNVDCLYDNQVATDANGYYTIAVSTVRPLRANARNGISWIGNSASEPLARHALIVRNMMPNNFSNAIQNIVPGLATYKNPAQAELVMQQYYPKIYTCPRVRFELFGMSACTLVQ